MADKRMAEVLVKLDAKPWYESKTLWVNIVVMVLSVALFVLQGISDGALVLPFEVSPELIIFLIGLLNAGLRLFTVQPVKK